jgi:hypothetical protein
LFARRRHGADLGEGLPPRLALVESGGHLALDEQLDVMRQLFDRFAIESRPTGKFDHTTQ